MSARGSKNQAILLSPALRTLLALVLPIVGTIIVAILAGSRTSELALPLVGAGLVSWFLGVQWYGIAGMGLRGKRPLFASIGFAVLGWVIILIVRFYFVSIEAFGIGTSTRAFFYLLLFEAFCVQLWAFGTFFKSLADWRGPLTAAISSGILFGLVAALFFQESFINSLNSFTFFLIWGIFYGIIRLRTGSLLGIVLIQAMQSFTAWTVMQPTMPPDVRNLQSMYLIATFTFLILIWRLWPKLEEDYRV